jgi:hypothetical protein
MTTDTKRVDTFTTLPLSYATNTTVDRYDVFVNIMTVIRYVKRTVKAKSKSNADIAM